VTVIYKTFLAMVSFGIDRKSQKCVEFISGCNISFLGSVTNQGWRWTVFTSGACV